MLAGSVLTQKQVFGPRTAKSQPIWIKFCIHLLADLDRDRHVGGSRPNQNDYVFVILVTHSKSYIETMDRSDFDGKPSKWTWGRVLLWKIPEFCSMGGARSKKQHFFAFLGYPSTILHTAYRKQFYPKPTVPMESQDSGGVPFARLARLWPGIWQIDPEGCQKSSHMSITKLEICIQTHLEKFTDSKNAILFDLLTKNNEVIAEKPFQKWRHQTLVNAWPSWIDAHRQYILLVIIIITEIILLKCR